MRFTINLVTKPHLDHRRVQQACIGALLLMSALLAWNAFRIIGNAIELRRLGGECTAMESRLATRPTGVSEKEYTRLLASIRFYNDIIDHKSYSWLGLLDQVENATPEGIALVSLVPAKDGAELKLEGRAHSFNVVRSYIEKLEDSHDFANVLLLSNRDLSVGSKDRGVQFSISCRVVSR